MLKRTMPHKKPKADSPDREPDRSPAPGNPDNPKPELPLHPLLSDSVRAGREDLRRGRVLSVEESAKILARFKQ